MSAMRCLAFFIVIAAAGSSPAGPHTAGLRGDKTTIAAIRGRTRLEQPSSSSNTPCVISTSRSASLGGRPGSSIRCRKTSKRLTYDRAARAMMESPNDGDRVIRDGMLHTKRPFPGGLPLGAAMSSSRSRARSNEGRQGPVGCGMCSARAGGRVRGHTGDIACDHYHRTRTTLR